MDFILIKPRINSKIRQIRTHLADKRLVIRAMTYEDFEHWTQNLTLGIHQDQKSQAFGPGEYHGSAISISPLQ